MPTAKRVTKKPVVPAPQNLEEAAEYIRKIGERQRAIDRVNNDLNAKIEEVKKPFMDESAQYQKEYDHLVEGLYAYAQGHRKDLTQDEKVKTVQLPTGAFSWRMSPKSVSITGEEAIIATLKALKLIRFIRTKETVDKEAMLKEQDIASSVQGVTIGQEENFYVKPAESKAEIMVTPGKKSIKITTVSDDSDSGKKSKKKEKKLA